MDRDAERQGGHARPDHDVASPAGWTGLPPVAADDKPLEDMLEHLAFYTRQYFMLQERLLNEYCRDAGYARSRLADLGELRRRLARVCVDHASRDADAHTRLGVLCRDLRNEMAAHGAELARLGGEFGDAGQRRQPAANSAQGSFGPRLPRMA